MRPLAERVYFRLCLALGRLLRSGRYARVEIVGQEGERHARKRRLLWAPLLVWLGGPLLRILNTGVRVLPQREWEERERMLYQNLHGSCIRIDGGRVLRLPYLTGQTLATLLEDHRLEESIQRKAIEHAVVALAALHERGFTHGDALAENVMVDLAAGIARWFDFETVHDAGRPMTWRRADDLRALLTTCLLRTAPDRRAELPGFILDVYADEEVTRMLAASFASVFQRTLTFHLGQAGLSFEDFRELGRLLQAAGPHGRRPRGAGVLNPQAGPPV